MEYRKMGNTGLFLSALSYGSWVTFHHQVDDQLGDRLMGMAYDAGVNFFDNAEAYEGGRAEEVMGRILKNKNWDRTTYTVSSKAFFGLYGKDNKPTQRGLSRKHLTEACNQSLKRMGMEYLDLFFCHRPDPETPMEEIVWTMNILIQQGKILYWGTSEWSAEEIEAAHATAKALSLIPPAMEQPQYNLFERQKMEHDYLNIFKTHGMGTTIWSPLASGLLTGKYINEIPEGSRLSIEKYGWLKERMMDPVKLEKVKQLKSIADDLNVPLSTFSLAWTLKNPNVTTTILGATKESQLAENLKALEVVSLLDDAVMARIEKVLAL